MSFDLYFCWLKKTPVNFDLVAEWSEEYRHFQRNNDQLWYSNEDTGVYFSLDFEIKDAENQVIPSDYVDSGLSFNLNFNRPSFFAFEAMPIIIDLCERFGFTVFDPQGFDEATLNQKPEVEELTESWLRSNRNAIAALQEHQAASSFRMPLSSSKYLWSYSRGKQELQTVLGDDIFVPGLYPFRRTESTQIGTMIVCTSGIPMILPAADWVVIQRPKKRFFGMGEDTETGVVSARIFQSAVGNLISPFADWEPSVNIINPDFAGAVAKHLDSIQDMLPLNDFERVALDSFIDLEDELTIKIKQ